MSLYLTSVSVIFTFGSRLIEWLVDRSTVALVRRGWRSQCRWVRSGMASTPATTSASWRFPSTWSLRTSCRQHFAAALVGALGCSTRSAGSSRCARSSTCRWVSFFSAFQPLCDTGRASTSADTLCSRFSFWSDISTGLHATSVRLPPKRIKNNHNQH